MTATGQGGGGAQQVVGDRRVQDPAAIGTEPPGGHVGQGSVDEAGEDGFDDGVTAVGDVGIGDRFVGVGEKRVVPPDRKQGANSSVLTWSLTSLIRDPARRTPELVAEIIAAAQQAGFTAFEQWQRDEILWDRLRTENTSQLPAFPCPTLIIHGEKDTGVPVARARAAAALIPDAELKIVAGAGHWVQRDQPDVVIAAMLDFLGRRAAG